MDLDVSKVREIDVENHNGERYYDVYEDEVKDTVESNDLESNRVRELPQDVLYDISEGYYSSVGKTELVNDVEKVVFCESSDDSDSWLSGYKDSTYTYYIYDCSSVRIKTNGPYLLGEDNTSAPMKGVVMSVYQKVDLKDLVEDNPKTNGTSNKLIVTQDLVSSCQSLEMVIGDSSVVAAYDKYVGKGFVKGQGIIEDYDKWTSIVVSDEI